MKKFIFFLFFISLIYSVKSTEEGLIYKHYLIEQNCESKCNNFVTELNQLRNKTSVKTIIIGQSLLSRLNNTKVLLKDGEGISTDIIVRGKLTGNLLRVAKIYKMLPGGQSLASPNSTDSYYQVLPFLDCVGLSCSRVSLRVYNTIIRRHTHKTSFPFDVTGLDMSWLNKKLFGHATSVVLGGLQGSGKQVTLPMKGIFTLIPDPDVKCPSIAHPTCPSNKPYHYYTRDVNRCFTLGGCIALGNCTNNQPVCPPGTRLVGYLTFTGCPKFYCDANFLDDYNFVLQRGSVPLHWFININLSGNGNSITNTIGGLNTISGSNSVASGIGGGNSIGNAIGNGGNSMSGATGNVATVAGSNVANAIGNLNTVAGTGVANSIGNLNTAIGSGENLVTGNVNSVAGTSVNSVANIVSGISSANSLSNSISSSIGDLVSTGINTLGGNINSIGGNLGSTTGITINTPPPTPLSTQPPLSFNLNLSTDMTPEERANIIAQVSSLPPQIQILFLNQLKERLSPELAAVLFEQLKPLLSPLQLAEVESVFNLH